MDIFDQDYTIVETEKTSNYFYEVESYAEDLANKIIAYLQTASASKFSLLSDKPKIIIASKNKIEGMIGIYACIFIGAIYIPIDISQPKVRLRKILSEASADLILLGEDIILDNTTNTMSISGSISKVIDRALPKHLSIFEILNRQRQSEDIMSVLFTSGSTGTPKGIAISYRAALSFAYGMKDLVGLQPGDKIASFAPFYFDLSIFDLFSSIISKASLCFVAEDIKSSPYLLAQWIHDKSITHIYTVPSMLKFLALKGGLERFNYQNLRTIVFAGEVFPIKFLRVLINKLEKVAFYNFFGPTETNVCCYWKCCLSTLNELEEVPIGSSFNSSELKIDESTNELLVRGNQLMSGYWSNGKLPEKVDPPEWYHTGDKVALSKDGLLLFRGRLDKMIKRFGFRIDLLEIESCLLEHEEISEVVVLNTEQEEKHSIVAHLVSENLELDRSEIHAWLMHRLPSYMYIDKLYFYEKLPRLSNGKINIEMLMTNINFN
jgi:L-proline---[L-prolyl-carrier protein] ligase